MILDKYAMKRKLGKGAYGQVLLVEDDKGNNYALKLITMKSLRKQTYLLQYLQGEIQCMKDIDSPYVMKLFKTDEDQDYKYLFCEYCDGGDLLNLQSKQNARVFTLEKACEIMSEVIKGLYDLHQKGYLHRDIKSQNILVKMENGKETFKLADFGFSKKFQNICATILGTQTYMSPQIFKNQGYGYEVDMWAFGVLFYFMLNMEFPFKINPHETPEKKQIKLEEAGKNFSYKKYVRQSKKKLLNNCTQEVEQLFKQIFHPQADQRITFAEIRQTKLFIKYFPQKNQASRILYNQKKFINKLEKKQIQKKPKKQASDMQQNIRQTVSVIKRNDKNYPKQKALLSNKKDSIDFLRDNTLQFLDGQNVLKPEQKNSLSFNLLKYYIILIRQFIDNLNPTFLLKQYPNMQWQGFSKTNAFKQIKSEAEQDKLKMQVKFDQLYDQCSYLIKQIQQLNPKFKAAYEKQITQKSFEGAFRDSYRKSTNISFNTIRTLIRNSAKTGNILNYNLAILVISHVFNHIFNDKQNMQKIFEQYFSNKKKTVQTIDYEQLREWMTKATASQLNSLAKQIIQLYFS